MHAGRWETMLFPDTRIMPNAGVEDPFLYIDQHTKVLHAVFHNQIEGVWKSNLTDLRL